MSDLQDDTATQSSRWLAWGLTLCLGVGLFFSGIHLGRTAVNETQAASLWDIFNTSAPAVAATGEPDLSEFWKVWNTLDEKFATGSSTVTMSTEEKVEGAIEGLVKAYGDPYTVYLPPVETEAFNEDISGEFSGVGMEVGLRDGLVTIIAPLSGTPAEQAGLFAGDVIVRIDDVSTEGMRIGEAVKLIRGERGTEVVLTIFREGEFEFLDIPVVRDTIEIPTVKSEQVGDVFIVTLYSFNAVAESKMKEALQEYTQSGAQKLIVDVRGNPGGFLQSAVSIASHFLPSGKVVVREQYSASEMEDAYRTRGRQIQLFNPSNLVVLVDGGSASASEILAGALQDHGVATIIGAQTFGKGSVQELVEFDSGSALKVTIARWLTPNGTSISEGGLTPDIVISRTPQQRLAAEDPQRVAALRFMAGEEVVSESFEAALQTASSSETGE